MAKRKDDLKFIYRRGYKIQNDRGHYLIYDKANQFAGSCDAEELYRMLDELDTESEG